MKYYRSPLLHSIPELLHCEYVEADSILDAQNKGAELIDLAYQDYCRLQADFSVSSLDSYYLGAADSLIKLTDRFHFFQLSQKAFLTLLSRRAARLKTDDYAVIVGDELTISQFLPALAKLGYSRFVLVVENPESSKDFIQHIQKTILGLQLIILGFHQVSSIDCIASFLLVDIDHEQLPELVESFTYFNFLTTGSAFLDVRSPLTNYLVQEAERAHMFVLDSAQYAQVRIEIAKDVLIQKS